MTEQTKKPNIIYVMADDHACNAISSYGSEINETPNIDRLAEEGMKLTNCLCTNSICSPSRAVILTGTYNHINDVKYVNDCLDNSQLTFPQLLQKAGYQTAIVGKWHLGHGEKYDPVGFDYWNVLYNHGSYFDSRMVEMGEYKNVPGYVTDVVTDISLDWIKNRDEDKPFFLMCHHKAPHAPWQPDDKHEDMYDDVKIPEPETFNDDFTTRADPAKYAKMKIKNMDLFAPRNPEDFTEEELKDYKYQEYIKNYLRCVASIDDNVGRILDYLDEEGIADETIVIYTSDQGFFLGEHGWYDKRFMYEESLQMPFLIRYPEEIEAGSSCDQMILNLDFPETFLDFAGIETPSEMQGRSFKDLLYGDEIEDWRDSMYYRYWMKKSQHNVAPHYGLRTERYKLICYEGPAVKENEEPAPGFEDSEWPQWELFDIKEDPNEINNIYHDPEYKDLREELKEKLFKKQKYYGDKD